MLCLPSDFELLITTYCTVSLLLVIIILCRK